MIIVLTSRKTSDVVVVWQEEESKSMIRKSHDDDHDDADAEKDNLSSSSAASSSSNLTNNNYCENERRAILTRAQRWLDAKVPYQFFQFHDGYRQQCSGFLSAAWNLTVVHPKDTPRCFHLENRGLAVVINKADLQMGDAIVCNALKYKPIYKDEYGNNSSKPSRGQQGGGHCFLFEQWVDHERKTSFIGWELCKDANCQGVTRREIPYPYFYKQNCFEPMRRTDLVRACGKSLK